VSTLVLQAAYPDAARYLSSPAAGARGSGRPTTGLEEFDEFIPSRRRNSPFSARSSAFSAPQLLIVRTQPLHINL
jgi:hypothetical protein